MPKHPGGAPLQNRNGVRHGLTAQRLPKGCGWLVRDTEALRRTIEDAVAERNDGEISIFHAALINSSIKWERHGMLSARWLRLHHDEMSHADRLTFSREVAKAASQRDKCLERLGLDKTRRQSVIDALYSATEPSEEQE